MNIFERFSRVAKANVNELLNKMEDPEKVMNQAVEDLQKDLVKIRQSYAEVMATQKRTAAAMTSPPSIFARSHSLSWTPCACGKCDSSAPPNAGQCQPLGCGRSGSKKHIASHRACVGGRIEVEQHRQGGLARPRPAERDER